MTSADLNDSHSASGATAKSNDFFVCVLEITQCAQSFVLLSMISIHGYSGYRMGFSLSLSRRSLVVYSCSFLMIINIQNSERCRACVQ